MDMDRDHHLRSRCNVRLSTCILHSQYVPISDQATKMESVSNFDVLLNFSHFNNRKDLHNDNDGLYDQKFWRRRYTHACRT